MKYFRLFIFIGIIGMLISSCVKKENYPDYPVISFNSFIPFGTSCIPDSAYLRLNFTDGNGQIGYPQQDTSAPSDFFVITLMKNTNTGLYDTMKNLSGSPTLWTYKIPYITPTGSDKELNGIIQINFETLLQPYCQNTIKDHDNTKYEFVVWMYDRNGNKSNVLNTGPVSTCP